MKIFTKIASLGLLAALAGCGKQRTVTPVVASHDLTFTTNASGYTTVLSLQKIDSTAESAAVLATTTNNGTIYSYKTTIKTGEHLLITVSPDNPKAVYHYQIDDNNAEATTGDLNVAAGTSVIIHYPKDSN